MGTNEKNFMVFTQKLAGWLMIDGFVMLYSRKDRKSNRNVFFFKDTEKLHERIDYYNKHVN